MMGRKTSVVPSIPRSCTKMSVTLLVSLGTRFGAYDANATDPPLEVMEGDQELKFTWIPPEVKETRSVRPVNRSWTKTSPVPFVSPFTRLSAHDSNATKRPSAEIDG